MTMRHPFTDAYHPELAAPRTPEAVIDLARCLQREIRAAWDLYVERVVGAHLARTGQRIVCGPGCDTCCHFLVLVPRYSGVVLAAELVGRGMEDARQRVYAHANLIRQQSYSYQSVKEIDEAVAAWTPFRQPCPLLAEGKCSVYSARTVTCAGLLALDAPCNDPASKQRIRHETVLGPLEQAADQLFSSRVGVPTGPVPLTLAIMQADELLDSLVVEK